MKTFDESDRLNLPLSADSVVLDIGAHTGWFTAQLWDKFHCNIHAFEPCEQFRKELSRRFARDPKVRIYEYALGDKDTTIRMGIKGDMTGAFCPDPNDYEVMQMRDVVPVLDGIGPVDCATVNCEGGEYALLERLLDSGRIGAIRHLSVQFHTVVPDYQARMDAIIERLKNTHEHVYGSSFIWDGFTLRQ